MPTARRAWTCTAILFSLAGVASWATAHGVDSTLSTTITVGSPRGSAPMGRIDAARTGRSPFALPEHPRLLWRIAAASSLDLLPVAVDAHGAVILGYASLPQVTQIGPDGTRQWRTTIGQGPPLTGPVILSDDTRVVVTSAGEIVGLHPDGEVRFRTDLGLPGRSARVAPLPLEKGGVAIAIGLEVVMIAADGEITSRHALGERPTGALVATRRGIAVTSDTGHVYVVDEGHPVRPLGSLGGDPGPGAATPDGNWLVAVVDHKRLVSFDMHTGSSQTLYAASAPSVDGPVTAGAHAAWFMTDFSGTLLRYEDGEMHRASLGLAKPSLLTDGGVVNLNAMAESPPLLSDATGAIAFARVGGGIGIVTPSGVVRLLEGAGCTSPAALAPAGPKRMAVACRDGALLMVGDEG